MEKVSLSRSCLRGEGKLRHDEGDTGLRGDAQGDAVAHSRSCSGFGEFLCSPMEWEENRSERLQAAQLGGGATGGSRDSPSKTLNPEPSPLEGLWGPRGWDWGREGRCAATPPPLREHSVGGGPGAG